MIGKWAKPILEIIHKQSSLKLYSVISNLISFQGKITSQFIFSPSTSEKVLSSTKTNFFPWGKFRKDPRSKNTLTLALLEYMPCKPLLRHLSRPLHLGIKPRKTMGSDRELTINNVKLIQPFSHTLPFCQALMS